MNTAGSQLGDDAGIPVFDAGKFRSSIGGDQQLLSDLIEIFPEDCDQFVAEIRAAFSDCNAEALMQGTHALKGLLGHYAAQRAYNCSAKLDALAISGDIQAARPIFDELLLEIHALKSALADYQVQ